MKSFLKYTFATITGLVITGIIVGVISMIALVGIISSFSAKGTVKLADNSVAVLKLNGRLTERNQEDPVTMIMGTKYPTLSLQDVLQTIQKAKNASQIEGLHIDAGSLSAAPASLEEIRAALLDFKKSGKFITAYSDSYTQGTYYLCSVADKVLVNPQGMIDWMGLNSQIMFYKELMDKAGVEMQVFKVGTYKSAVEPFIGTKMSDANREQTLAFMNSVWGRIVSGVSQSRKIPADTLNAYADRLLSFDEAPALLGKHLVDTLVYRNDVEDYLNRTYNKKKKDKDKKHNFHLYNIEDMVIAQAEEQHSGKDGQVAVYYAEGAIDDEDSTQPGAIHAPQVCKELRELAEDDDVKAVVLRVNSPGGSAFGSEQIWHEVVNIKKKKPVIVSMGDYAASGGYYISCAADTIVADATTLTGSIGIFGMIPNAKGLADKVGIHFDGVSTNKHSGLSVFEPLDTESRAAMQANIERGYRLFVKRCADGRGMTVQAIDSIGQGRVWTGEMAKQRGLVDLLGGLDKAVEVAAAKAGLKEYKVQDYPAPQDTWTMLMDMSMGGARASVARAVLGENYSLVNWLDFIRKQSPVQARMPFELKLNL